MALALVGCAMANSVTLELPVGATPAPQTDTAKKEPVRARSHARRAWLTSLVVLIGAVVAVVVVVYLRSRPAASAFRTVAVLRADITQHVTATGTLEPVITSPVGAQVSGIVWKLHADFNSQVKAGQLLVELDPALFDNAVELARAQLAASEASLTSAQATALGARMARDRTLKLEQGFVASQQDVDATEAVFGQSIGLARTSAAQIAQARAQLDRAQLDLQHSVIRSPVDGTVISRNVDVGQAVAATLTAPTLFTIAQDLRHMQVHAAVDEADIGDVHEGQSATFTVDAFRNQTFTATVNEVRNAPQTLSNVVTYDVVLDVENPEQRLRPGMTANVLVLIAQRSQVTAVPNEALRFRPAARPAATGHGKVLVGDAVYVQRGDTAARIPITTGVTDGSVTEVEGLTSGQQVIVDVARGKSSAAPAAGGGGRGR